MWGRKAPRALPTVFIRTACIVYIHVFVIHVYMCFGLDCKDLANVIIQKRKQNKKLVLQRQSKLGFKTSDACKMLHGLDVCLVPLGNWCIAWICYQLAKSIKVNYKWVGQIDCLLASAQIVLLFALVFVHAQVHESIFCVLRYDTCMELICGKWCYMNIIQKPGITENKWITTILAPV